MFRSSDELETAEVFAPSMKSADSMFGGGGAPKLVSFKGDLSSLQNGYTMFYRCGLASFDAELPALTNGQRMFDTTKLDLPSVQRIARSIKDNSDMATAPTLTLGVDKNIKGLVDTELALIRAKGWSLTARYF